MTRNEMTNEQIAIEARIEATRLARELPHTTENLYAIEVAEQRAADAEMAIGDYGDEN